MNFAEFAAAHGLLIRDVEFGRWIRTATEDKPNHKNGAYRHLGDVAFVQNHATMSGVAVWFPDGDSDIKVDRSEMARIRANADRQIAQNRASACQKALNIIGQARHEQHAYLDSKGFPDALGLVYHPDEHTNLLIIPMRAGKQLVGCQLIDRDGGKRFLFGQQCSGAAYVIGNHGIDIWCEGYATGLSVNAVMAALKTPARIHVCFSASNMQAMATHGIVVADNDVSQTGEKAAQATGLPYFMPDTDGDDFNDFHRKVGTFTASQALRNFLQEVRRAKP